MMKRLNQCTFYEKLSLRAPVFYVFYAKLNGDGRENLIIYFLHLKTVHNIYNYI